MNPIVVFVAFIFGSRLFTLFAFYPIATATYARYDESLVHLPLLLGCYSFFQSFFQLVWAALSQKVGRLKMVRLGLTLFFVSSIAALLAPSLEILLIARSLQGASAIGATTQALLADHLTDLKELQTAYYQIGVVIVLSFMLSFIVGPLFQPLWLFFLTTASLAFLSLLASFAVPSLQTTHLPRKASTSWEWVWPSVDIAALLFVNFGLHFLQAVAIGSYQIIARPGTYELASLFVVALLVASKPLKERHLRLSFTFAQQSLLLSAPLLLIWAIFGLGYTKELLAILCGTTFMLLLLLEAALPAQLRLSAHQNYPLWIGMYTTLQSLGIALGSLSLYVIGDPIALVVLLALPILGLVIGLSPLRRAALAQPAS